MSILCLLKLSLLILLKYNMKILFLTLELPSTYSIGKSWLKLFIDYY